MIGGRLINDFPHFTLYLHSRSIRKYNNKNHDHEPRRCRSHARGVETIRQVHSQRPTGDAHQRQEEEAVAEAVSILTGANRFCYFRLEAECLHLNKLIGSLHGRAQAGGKHEDSDYKVLKRKQWEARGRIFFLQGSLCGAMPAVCEPELIDMRYGCQAVAAPTSAILIDQDHISRDMERNVQEAGAYIVSKHIWTGANRFRIFSDQSRL